MGPITRRSARSQTGSSQEPPKKKAPTKKQPPVEEEEERDESSSEEEQEEPKTPPRTKNLNKKKQTAKKAPQQAKKPNKKQTPPEEEEGSEPEPEENSEEEEPSPPQTQVRNKKFKTPTVRLRKPETEPAPAPAPQSAKKNGANTTATGGKRRAGMNGEKKQAIWELLTDLLQESQHANSSERKKLYKKYQKEFYSERNPSLVNEHQKYFAQSLWRMSVLPFKEPNSPGIEKTLKFLHMIYLNCGTDPDKEAAGFELDTYPMFYYVVKLIIQSHMDERKFIRQRIMEIFLQIFQQHDGHACLNNPSVRQQLFEKVAAVRLRDKIPQVRAIAASVLKFFIQDDPTLLKDLKYYSRFDPNPDVRKAAMASVVHVPPTKISFLYDHAFDQDWRVRMEAFANLSERRMANLHFEKREKVLYWGLQQDGRVLKVVTEKLLPAWFEQYDKNPIEFLKQLGIGTKTEVAFKILNHIYTNDHVETFESIDRGFLNEDNLIPVDKLSIESVIFWTYMIKQFRATRYNMDKLVPKPDVMPQYIQNIVDAIHAEHENALADDRDEDVTLLVCLSYVISIAISIGLEEGTRRGIEESVRNILLDPVLDEAILVKCAVDAMQKLDKNPNSFSDKMMEIFQKVFEPSERTLLDQSNPATPRRKKRSSSRRSTSVARSAGTGSRGNSVPRTPKTPKAKTPRPMISLSSVGLDDLDNTVTDGNNEEPRTPTRGSAPLTESELIALRDKQCRLALNRLRLAEEKNTAIKGSNFLEANRLHEIIEGIRNEEQMVREQLQTPQQSFASGGGDVSMRSGGSRPKSLPASASSAPGSAGQRGRNSVHQEGSRGQMDDSLDGGGGGEGAFFSQGTEGGELALSNDNLLKGLIMLTRFLSISPKLTPFVRQLYQSHISSFLLEDQESVRSHAMYFLCMVAKIEPGEKRKIMSLLLRGLQGEQEIEVQRAAFKSIIDLLLHYEMSDFKYDYEDAVVQELPEEFNNPEATLGEIEHMFVTLLFDNYANEEDGSRTAAIAAEKISAMIKMIHCGRLKSENTISHLLCMWSEKQYAGTPIPYNIGMWIPAYTKLSFANAKLVAKGLLLSVRRMIAPGPDDSFGETDIQKLIDFVVQFISPAHLDMANGEKIHEELILDILKGIIVVPNWTGNSALMKLATKLQITGEEGAQLISESLQHVLLKIQMFPLTPTMTSLRTGIKGVLQKIAKQFPVLERVAEANIPIASDSEEEGRNGRGGRERNPFSDEDEPALFNSDDDSMISLPRHARSKNSTFASTVSRSSVNSQADGNNDNGSGRVPSTADLSDEDEEDMEVEK